MTVEGESKNTEKNAEKKRTNGPNFLQRLLGKKVSIYFVGDEGCAIEATIRGYNRYEILADLSVEDVFPCGCGDDQHLGKISQAPVTSVLMKHAIAFIVPMEPVSFVPEKKHGDQVKKEEGKHDE